MKKLDFGDRTMNLPHQIQCNYETVGQGSNFIFLSLYLLLLAFFIFLVSISEVEQSKSDQVLESVRETFPGKSWVQPVKEIPEASSTGDFKVRIKGLFEPVLGDKGVVINGRGEYVLVKLKTSLLFNDPSNGTIFSSSTEEILKKISTLLSQDIEDSRRPYLTIIIGDQQGRSFDANQQTTDMVRLEKIVNYLLDQGAIKKTVSIGLDDFRSNNEIHFQFSLKPLSEPSLNLGKKDTA